MNWCLGAEDTHVSIFIYLMWGDNDDNLKWPFKGTIKVSLLNQLEDGLHLTRQLSSPYSDIPESSSGRVTEGERSEGWGNAEFVSHLDLDNDTNKQFLKDDMLFFRVDSIEPDLDWPYAWYLFTNAFDNILLTVTVSLTYEPYTKLCAMPFCSKD